MARRWRARTRQTSQKCQRQNETLGGRLVRGGASSGMESSGPVSRGSAWALRVLKEFLHGHSIATCVGDRCLSVLAVPAPVSPFMFSPQHHSVPSFFRAQVWRPPTLTSATSASSLRTSTGNGLGSNTVPSPISPARLGPQHQSVPSVGSHEDRTLVSQEHSPLGLRMTTAVEFGSVGVLVSTAATTA